MGLRSYHEIHVGDVRSLSETSICRDIDALAEIYSSDVLVVHIVQRKPDAAHASRRGVREGQFYLRFS